MKYALIARNGDNVANVIDDIKAGDEISYISGNTEQALKAVEDIKFGFKVAVKAIEKSKEIIKYGCVIGKASKDIKPGECVHIHNVEGTRGRGDKEGE